MSDRVAVFNHGRIEQIGAPAEIYERPRTALRRRFRRHVQRPAPPRRARGSRRLPRPFSMRPGEDPPRPPRPALRPTAAQRRRRDRASIYLGATPAITVRSTTASHRRRAAELGDARRERGAPRHARAAASGAAPHACRSTERDHDARCAAAAPIAAPACDSADWLWSASRLLLLPAAGAAAAVARRRLSRLAARAAAAELLLPRRLLAAWSCASSRSPPTRELFTLANLDIVAAHRRDGGAVTCAAAAWPFRSPTTWRATPAADEGAALSRRHAAAVVELSRPRLCLEADPGQGGHHHWLADRARLTWLLDAVLALPGHRRPVAVDLRTSACSWCSSMSGCPT